MTIEPVQRPGRRLFVECSQTAVSGMNTGIQRVVRKIIGQWQKNSPADVSLHLVTFDGKHYFEIDSLPDKRHQSVDGTENASKSKKGSLKTRLMAGRVSFAALMPFEAAKRFILAPRQQRFSLMWLIYQSCIRPVKSLRNNIFPVARPDNITFQPGDILLLLDATWQYPPEKLAIDARAAGATVITVVYDLIPVNFPEFCKPEHTAVFSEWLKKSADFSDGFIAISKTVQTDISRFHQAQGMQRSSLDYGFFYLGAELSEISDIAIRNELTEAVYKENSYLIVCTVEPRKNHRFLLNAFQLLWQQGLDVRLHIVGKAGWKTEALIRQITVHSEYGRRLFLWQDLSDIELVYCYKNAKALIFPSIVEGFGLPIIEAQHYGLPVLASDTPIHREVGGEDIAYFRLSDPQYLADMLFAIENGQLQLPVANPSNVASYTWPNSAAQLWHEVDRISRLRRHSSQ